MAFRRTPAGCLSLHPKEVAEHRDSVAADRLGDPSLSGRRRRTDETLFNQSDLSLFAGGIE